MSQTTNSPPRLFLTGASGLLGANFLHTAVADFQITAVYAHHKVEHRGCSSVQADLQDRARILSVLDAIRPEWIVHFAAATNVDYCETNPSFAHELNVETTRTLASWAATHAAKMVYMSTDSVFDGKSGGYSEDSQTNPINVYAATKLQGEDVVRCASGEHLIVRANIYGWNAQPKHSLAEWMLSRFESGGRVPGFVDTTFAPLLVNTLSSLIIQLMKHGLHGTYHAACADPITKYGFARLLARAFGYPEVQVDQSRTGLSLKAPRPLNTWLAADKLRDGLGIALPTLAEDLLMFRSLRENGFVAELKSSYTET